MADDKGGGGGPGWGALEIVLGILLLIGLLDHLSNNKKPFSSSSVSEKNIPSILPADPDASCGLSVAHPKQLEKASTSIVLEGSVGYCNWRVYRNIALYAQVIDPEGRPVSAYTPVVPSAAPRGDIVPFRTTIQLNAVAKKGTGFLILVPAHQERSEETISVRIPIQF